MSYLSPKLREEVISAQIYKIIEAHPILGEFINAIMPMLSLKTFQPDEYIITQGKLVKDVFVHYRGKCEELKLIDFLKPTFIRVV